MKVMIALLFSVGVLSCALGTFDIDPQVDQPHRPPVGESAHDVAHQECMEDLEENCPHLYDYVYALEKENMRLHRDYSSCVRQLKEALGGGW
jgi:hypothetical protein